MSQRKTDDQARLRVQADPELEYRYYDIFNVFMGAEEVILELGNRHRGESDTGTIHQRVVLSPGTARRLATTLNQGIEAMEEQVRSVLGGQGQGRPN